MNAYIPPPSPLCVLSVCAQAAQHVLAERRVGGAAGGEEQHPGHHPSRTLAVIVQSVILVCAWIGWIWYFVTRGEYRSSVFCALNVAPCFFYINAIASVGFTRYLIININSHSAQSIHKRTLLHTY